MCRPRSSSRRRCASRACSTTWATGRSAISSTRTISIPGASTMRTSGARSSPVRWRTSSARSALHLRRTSSPASGSTRSGSPTSSRRRSWKDLSRRPGWRSCAPRWSAPTRPTTWTMSRATPIYVASRRGRSMCSASFTTRSSPSAASRCTPTPRKRFTCSSTRVSTSITRSTSTAPCAGSTCSCARCFGRRSSSCSGATP